MTLDPEDLDLSPCLAILPAVVKGASHGDWNNKLRSHTHTPLSGMSILEEKCEINAVVSSLVAATILFKASLWLRISV